MYQRERQATDRPNGYVLPESGMKRCTKCFVEKPLGEFYNRRPARDGKTSQCKACTNERAQAWEAAHPGRTHRVLTPKRRYDRDRRPYHMLKKYGITWEQYCEMLEAQGGLCAICRRPERLMLRGRLRRLSVDHDHETEAVRDLLCDACNNGLAKFDEEPDLLRAAADYLERHAAPALAETA